MSNNTTTGTTTAAMGSSYATPTECLHAMIEMWVYADGGNSDEFVADLLASASPAQIASDLISDGWLSETDFSAEDAEAILGEIAAEILGE